MNSEELFSAIEANNAPANNHHNNLNSSNINNPIFQSSDDTELTDRRERLIILLLQQVCALSDPTHRSFIEHCIKLHQLGIINNLNFLQKDWLPNPNKLLSIVPLKKSISANSDAAVMARSSKKKSLLTNSAKSATTTLIELVASDSSSRSSSHSYAQKFIDSSLPNLDLVNGGEEILTPGSSIPSVLASIEGKANGPNDNMHSNSPAPDDLFESELSAFVRSLNQSSSRYSSDFIELERIGAGGFGSVYKALSKIDSCVYAVKKIIFNHSGFTPVEQRKIFREVRCLAKLNDRNIVRYFNAWLEPVWEGNQAVGAPPGNTSDESANNGLVLANKGRGLLREESCSDPVTASVSFGEATGDVRRKSLVLGENSANSSSFPYDFRSEFPENSEASSANHSFDQSHADRSENQRSQPIEITKPQLIKQQTPCFIEIMSNSPSLSNKLPSNPPGTTENISKPSPNAVELLSRSDFHSFASSNLRYKLCLYIQTQFCMGQTLLQYINQPSRASSSAVNMRIFAQIISALAHAHKLDIIHRDLKPANLFITTRSDINAQDIAELQRKGANFIDLSEVFVIKLGDFGLAVENIENQGNQRDLGGNKQGNGKVAVGTRSYAAPEQLCGAQSSAASDIYSAGIILFELYNKFGTQMERLQALSALRKGELSSGFVSKWPQESRIILSMCQDRPNQRPTAYELLNDSFVLQFAPKPRVIAPAENSTAPNPQANLLQLTYDAAKGSQESKTAENSNNSNELAMNRSFSSDHLNFNQFTKMQLIEKLQVAHKTIRQQDLIISDLSKQLTRPSDS
jgi:serine/threonine protein kinase